MRNNFIVLKRYKLQENVIVNTDTIQRIAPRDDVHSVIVFSNGSELCVAHSLDMLHTILQTGLSEETLNLIQK